MKNDGVPSIENGDAASQDARTATPALSTPHADSCAVVLSALGVSRHGISHAEAAVRLEHYGRNALPRARPPGVVQVFLHQFTSPLIYVLVAAALVSLAIQE